VVRQSAERGVQGVAPPQIRLGVVREKRLWGERKGKGTRKKRGR
jgi:hypothetical protein